MPCWEKGSGIFPLHFHTKWLVSNAHVLLATQACTGIGVRRFSCTIAYKMALLTSLCAFCAFICVLLCALSVFLGALIHVHLGALVCLHPTPRQLPAPPNMWASTASTRLFPDLSLIRRKLLEVKSLFLEILADSIIFGCRTRTMLLILIYRRGCKQLSQRRAVKRFSFEHQSWGHKHLSKELGR